MQENKLKANWSNVLLLLVVLLLCGVIFKNMGKGVPGSVSLASRQRVAEPLGSRALAPSVPYYGMKDDIDAVNEVVVEIRRRFPWVNQAEFVVAAGFWLYNRDLLATGDDTDKSIAGRIRGYNLGSCGDRSLQLGMIFSAVGIEHRLVNMFGLRKPMGGHTAVEALVDGRWLFVDPKLGLVFGKDGGSDLGTYRILSLEEALTDKDRPVELMFRCLYTYGPVGTRKHERYLSMFGEDPYNAVITDITSIVSPELPDLICEKMLESLKAPSFREYLSDNSTVCYTYRTSYECREPDTMVARIDLSKLKDSPWGKIDRSITDLRRHQVDSRTPADGLFFVGKYLTYHRQWMYYARNKLIVTNISEAGDLVISFFRTNSAPKWRDVCIEVCDITHENRPKIVLTKEVGCDESKGEFAIPIGPGASSRSLLVELTPVYSGLEANGLLYDSICFVPLDE